MSVSPEKMHQKFVSDVITHKKVWGLKIEDNWAVCKSEAFKDAEVLVFWSDKNLADACATDDWHDYKPVLVDTAEFLVDWLPGMQEEGIAVGTNWSTDLDGIEMDPVSLALELVQELREQNIDFIPEGYKSLSEFEAFLLEIAEDL